MKIETVLTRVLSVVFFVALIACGGKKESSNDESAEFDAAKEELKQKIITTYERFLEDEFYLF